jgi:hypothetical protein
MKSHSTVYPVELKHPTVPAVRRTQDVSRVVKNDARLRVLEIVARKAIEYRFRSQRIDLIDRAAVRLTTYHGRAVEIAIRI